LWLWLTDITFVHCHWIHNVDATAQNSPYNFMYIVGTIVRLVGPTWWYKMNCLFLFHIFNIQSCIYGIYKGFSRNKINCLLPRITRQVSDDMVTGILDVQFVMHFCTNASKVCLCCLYFNLVTLFTDLCPGLHSWGMYIRWVWGEYPH